jgi:hypothetical protein
VATQNISVTFTPQQTGLLKAIMRVALASATIYVDPVLTIV